VEFSVGVLFRQGIPDGTGNAVYTKNHIQMKTKVMTITQPAISISFLRNLPVKTAYCVATNVIKINKYGQGVFVYLAYNTGNPVRINVFKNGRPIELLPFQNRSSRSSGIQL
jgi:hypothetical protein